MAPWPFQYSHQVIINTPDFFTSSPSLSLKGRRLRATTGEHILNGNLSVILFSIDGMRPDGLMQAHTPAIDTLMDQGAHTLTAQTVMPSSTLPCHSSMFYGCLPERHGITTNTWTPQVKPVPSVIEVVHQAGGVTASFYNWEQLRDLSPPGFLDASFFLNNCDRPEGDHELADLAVRWMQGHEFALAFVYFGYVDIAGHNHEWMSDPYIEAIGNADQCIQKVLDAAPDSCLIMLTSDHGGHGQSHGTDCDEDMTTPVVLAGLNIPAGVTIDRPVRITDIAPTITQALQLTMPSDWIGSPLTFS